MAAVMNTVTVPPLADGLLARPEPLREGRRRLRAGLDRRAHLLCRRLLVRMDQHVQATLRMSLKTDLAMKKAERRGEM